MQALHGKNGKYASRRKRLYALAGSTALAVLFIPTVSALSWIDHQYYQTHAQHIVEARAV